MTPVLAPPGPGVAPRRGRLIWLTAVVIVVAMLAGLLVYAATYAPLSPGSFGGPSSASVKPLTDGVKRTRFILVGRTGQHGVVVYSLRNNGRFPVRVLGTPKDMTNWYLHMRPGPALGRGNLIGGHADEVKPFPVTVKPGEEVSLWVTLTKPPCRSGGFAEVNEIALRWSALGRTHVYWLPLDDDASVGQSVALCYPAEALEHVAS